MRHGSDVALKASDIFSAREGAPHEAEKSEYTIGELSREFGVTLRTLRFYENKGLLTPRREGLKRFYSAPDRARLALILKGKKLGFTLAEIRRMVAAEEGRADDQTLRLSQEKCQEQIQLLERQKGELEEALNELRRIHTALGSRVIEFNA